MRALDDGLVSWGQDDAIRFWDRHGNYGIGGDLKAHAGGTNARGVGGVLGHRDILVSWGWDGMIRFWDQHGQHIADRDLVAHKGGVYRCAHAGRHFS